MSKEDLEDGFWLGLLGPGGYLLSNRTRSIQQSLDRLSPAPANPDLGWADQLEVGIQQAADSLRAAAVTWEAADAAIDYRNDPNAEEASAEAVNNARSAAAPLLAFLEPIDEWVHSLETPPTTAGITIASLQLALTCYTGVARSLTAEYNLIMSSPVHDLDKADEFWAIFQRKAQALKQELGATR